MGVLGLVGTAKRGNGLSEYGRYDVKRKNNWVMTFKESFASTQFRHSLSVALFKAARPQFNFGEAKLVFANESWYVATKPDLQDLSVSMYDALPTTNVSYTFQRAQVDSPHPDKNAGQISAGQLMYNWVLLIYNPATGSIGLASEYKTESYITMYASVDTPIERWMYLGIFPKSVNLGDLDWTAEGDPLTVEVTYRYDKAYRIGPSRTEAPLSASDMLQPETPFFNIR